MTEIHLLVSDQNLSVTEKPVVATGAKKAVKTVFDFEGNLWNICGREAVFWNKEKPTEEDIIPVPLDVENSCEVPACVLTQEGFFYIGVIGYTNDGEIKKTSTIVKYPLRKGAPDGKGEVIEEPPDVWEQCLSIMGNTLSAAQEAINTASGAVGIANNALDTANDAVDTANEAVEKLDVSYVDEEGILHIYACENIKQIAPTIDVFAENEKVCVFVTNVDGTGKMVEIPSGEDGKDGSSATIQVEKIEGGHRLTIRDASGETEVNVMDGNSPIIELEEREDGTIIIVGNPDGTGQMAFIPNGKDGTSAELPEVTADDDGKVLGVSGGAWVAVEPSASENAVVTDVDLSGYETNGTVVETYSDGSTKTYTFEFDADGNPTKITDSNGNVQTITW